ncbi:MAG: riboflavin biosynthesis protein RibF [Verrucomicrobiota bacterium]
MKFPCSVDSFEPLASLGAPLHLAIGIFDGVHLGHKAVIESAVLSARRCKGVSGVLTFDPHPSTLFRPEDPTRLIMEIDAKVEMLHSVGVDLVIRKHFDYDFAGISADDFLVNLKQSMPTLEAIYVGENFRFGQKRAGDIDTLVESGRELDIAVFSVDRIKRNRKPISSTRIRASLVAGEIREVNHLLGYNYRAYGAVVGGNKLGRTIGFPTLNLPWVPQCLPRFGVYFVKFRSGRLDTWKPAVANYGVRPTVEDSEKDPLLEIHALGESELSSGDEIEVIWLDFIRAEQKFDSLHALKAQIALDREQAVALSSRYG